MTLRVKRTNREDADFLKLIDELNADQKVRNGDKHAFYMQFNQLDDIPYVLLIYKDDKAIACGSFKVIDKQQVEIKRMFTKKDFRRQGMAKRLLNEIELWAQELGFERLVLETGTMNPEAVQLYKNTDFEQIEKFGPYKEDEHSICFAKKLNTSC